MAIVHKLLRGTTSHRTSNCILYTLDLIDNLGSVAHMHKLERRVAILCSLMQVVPLERSEYILTLEAHLVQHLDSLANALVADELQLYIRYKVVLLADFDYNKVKKSQEKNSFIPILGKRISNDDGYYRAMSYGTNGRKNILKAFEVAEQIIKANINK